MFIFEHKRGTRSTPYTKDNNRPSFHLARTLIYQGIFPYNKFREFSLFRTETTTLSGVIFICGCVITRTRRSYYALNLAWGEVSLFDLHCSLFMVLLRTLIEYGRLLYMYYPIKGR